MKVLSWALVLLVGALAVVGCVGPYQGGPYDYGGAYGGAYYSPQPQNIYANPWVGANTPWTYYQGDWFLNGMLYNYYGNQYGWAPYYAYPPIYIVRPNNWYGPKWNTWYQQHPQYWQTFSNDYPYWRDHRQGQHYDQNFYNRYHPSQGEGWQKGFHGTAMERPRPEGPRPSPGQVTPHEGPKPGPGYMTPQGTRPGPGQMAPREATRLAPYRVTPREVPRPTPGQVTSREGPRPGPSQMAPREGPRPSAAPSGGRTTPTSKPERPGPVEEKH